MRRRWLLFLCCLLVPVFLVTQPARARGSLSINDSNTRLLFVNDGIEVSLAVINQAATSSSTIKLELLAPDDQILASSNRTETISKGEHQLRILLPVHLDHLNAEQSKALALFRLHCQITSTDGDKSETIISVSRIAPELFEIEGAASPMLHEGMSYRTRIKAFHPLTYAAAKDVRINGEITYTDKKTGKQGKTGASGITDRNGFAVLEFLFPEHLAATDVELNLTATRGQLTIKTNKSLQFYDDPRIVVFTDKPLYQPGQTLHIRLLMLNTSTRAVANETLNIRIKDPEDTLLYSTDVVTSRFGVTNADWQIPENSRLGQYNIEFQINEDTVRTRYFKVSRYDLPNFSVKVLPDKTYYLPNQPATVSVSADYLFGQQVARGHVRIVNETEREWNYSKQTYDITEGKTYEGETDATGVFKTKIDLSEQEKELKDSNEKKFRDLNYAAYFTDPTTNRTEQKRFTLRITNEAIHVYLIRPRNRYRESNRLPFRFYISTFYADGRPARCNVRITKADEEDEESGANKRLLASTSTNKFGLAKISRFQVPETATGEDEVKLIIKARDFRGRTGTATEKIEFSGDAAIDVTTNKTLFADGEPIEAVITSTEKDINAVVEVVRDWTIVHSQVVHLGGGASTITLPYKKEFKDELFVVAYARPTGDDLVFCSRTVLYPHKQNLQLEVHSDQRSYKPGESAQVDFRVRDRDGNPSTSSLGIVVIDKAVIERAESDQDLGSPANYNSEMQKLLGLDETVGGITRRDLNHVDMTRPVTADFELAAEVFLNTGSGYLLETSGNDFYELRAQTLFGDTIKADLRPLTSALDHRFAQTKQYPTDVPSLRRLLAIANVALDSFVDPWGTPYRPKFSTYKQYDVLELVTAGPDKTFDTEDDFVGDKLEWPYFQKTGETIDLAVRNYRTRTKDFIRNTQTLTQELKAQGIDFTALRDRWSHPYLVDFRVSQTYLDLVVTSMGPDGKKDKEYYGDDFEVWTSRIDYFADVRTRLSEALRGWSIKHDGFPENEAEARLAFKEAQIDFDGLRDAWGRPYKIRVDHHQFFGDKITIEAHSRSGEPAKDRLKFDPVTRRVATVSIHSLGPDATLTYDDFDIAAFSGIISDQSSQQSAPVKNTSPEIRSQGMGAISGIVKDSNGGVIFGATVQAINDLRKVFGTTTSSEGWFFLNDLPPGLYDLTITAPGFKSLVIERVSVLAVNSIELSLILEPGAVTETVEVSSSAVQTQTTSNSDASVNATRSMTKSFLLETSKQGRTVSRPTFTPRLRQYFPETLVWEPSLETDKSGKARLNFKLADNITTWRISVIGSTEDGQLGIAEKEITAFQPFFVDHDPPKILTEGDEIDLPVVVRNYLGQSQTVALGIKPESWFTLLGPETHSTTVAAGDSVRETFPMRMVSSVTEGQQRVTAQGNKENDAIEKPITVHPDGEEQSVRTGDIVDENATLTLDIPVDALPHSQGELKLYPNLMAHVAESVEAIMHRPYGCGEQTISSTYPSMLLLRRNKNAATNKKETSPLLTRAERYLNEGYARLLSYRAESGGFTYWGRGEPDVALTAYALRFLDQASDLISVDESVKTDARDWLLKQQSASGAWEVRTYDTKVVDPRASAVLTAYVARVLASSKVTPPANDTQLEKAFEYLELRIGELDEPYLLASFVLATEIKRPDKAAAAREKLVALAHIERGAAYWALETNTPFYGWGVAGRTETTALALQALNSGCASKNGSPGEGAQTCHRDLINKGLLFLLRGKDSYGVWYSSQTTINVLDALLRLLDSSSDTTSRNEQPTADVVVNGQKAASVQLPLGDKVTGPITIDLSAFLKNGANQIEIHRQGNSLPASVQAVANYYLPWPSSSAKVETNSTAKGSSSLRLVTKFDRLEGKVNEAISCHVEAERIGYHGYGMLLAEIGLPPGADVDRASLDKAVKASGYDINQYDVLPDRIVFYLWPGAGGVSFDFKFQPRFGLRAKTAASSIYDYYNPEARAVVAPVQVIVR